MKKEGFTLAEILTAITVIGVISAITLPVLMQNIHKQEYVTALKKTYSTLSQVTNQIIAEEGAPSAWDLGIDLNARFKFYDLYKNHLNNVRECDNKAGCFNYTKRLSGSGAIDSFTGNRGDANKLITADGVHIVFHEFRSDCPLAMNYWDIGSNYVCGRIYADVNGAKGPNTAGRDVFAFVLKKDGLYPAGCDSDKCSSAYTGLGCACKVLRENAMNY